ncbi:MAG: DUF1553 domain-containing protein [Verrucomicrobiae bacterium]|nr:DUF1553 domain-containing protein [Verrucomicrobiae bacterium]
MPGASLLAMFSRLPFVWPGLVLMALALPSPAADAPKIDFNFQIRPLLSDRCFTCHGPDSRARKKDLRLDTRDGLFKKLDDNLYVVKPGDTNRSELVRRIFATDDDQMPPEKSKRVLSAAEKDLLKRWVAEGAEYKPFWSFLPVEKITPPKHTSNWAKNPIDDFVAAKLATENLSPSPVAPRETLLRRLALDLTGLPPAAEDLDYFTADPSPDAYDRFVDKYLASPAYGERMALDWLDLARYADTYSYQQDEARDVSPWRDWVIQAFNTNLRYDEFLRWQLAGDLLPNATREQKLATAFNRLHRQTNEGGSIDEEFRAEYAADRVNTFGTAMLGLTVGCARCHDHKFDPITQRDYYSLFAYFNNIDEAGMYSHFTRATPTPTLWLWTPEQAAQHAALTNQIAAAESNLANIARASSNEFSAWLKTAKIETPAPIAHFKFDEITSNTTPDSCSPGVAKLEDDVRLVLGAPASGTAGSANFALQFTGDSEAVCKGVKEFKRTDEFSFSLRLKPTEPQDRAIILHQSKAREDAGSRGFELTLDHGRPFFGLMHFWPGNAIAVRAKDALSTNEWSHLVVTYDGSSRAAGIKIFLNGTPLETETIRDQLTKDIVHRAGWGDMEPGKVHLTLAARFRDSGFKNGIMDDLQVFDTALTEPEVKFLGAPGTAPASSAGDDQLLTYFLAHQSPAYHTALTYLKQLREQENSVADDVREIMTMQELRTRRVTHLLKRGAYDAPGDVVEPDTPSFMAKLPADAPRNRLGLANWLVDRKNPLTARVAVNRIWKLHFGRGLVATPDDFGSQGKLPTNPELLDYLAGWFMDNSWDVKALHRLIVSSATYQQTSIASKELLERDPDNALLARGPKTRLLAEEIRDEALAASGLLVTNLGGPSVKIYQPEGLWEQSGTGAKYTQDHGDKLYRRSLYTFWKRTAPPPAMLTFDAVTREVCTAKRETTATPLQALVLLNDPQFIEAARVLGENLLKQFPNDASARAKLAFKKLIGREPDATETKILGEIFTEQKDLFAKDETAAKKLLATGESRFDAALPPADFAATTLMVNAIMNFDEFIVER